MYAISTKKVLCLIIFSILLFRHSILAQPDTWNEKHPFGGGGRSDGVGFSIGNKGYVGLGSGSGAFQQDFWEYDPITDSWTQKADFGGGRRLYALGFSIGNKGYVGGGTPATQTTAEGNAMDFWEYNPIENKWIRKADIGYQIRKTGFRIGNRGYVLGSGRVFLEYNPLTNAWTRKADYPGKRAIEPLSFAIGQKGYISAAPLFEGPGEFWEYDQPSNTWSRKSNIPNEAREFGVRFSIGGKGFVATGTKPEDNSNYRSNFLILKDLWQYSPRTDTWVRKADFPGLPRAYAIAFGMGKKAYLGTGKYYSNSPSTYLSDFWEYTPETSTTPPTAFAGILQYYSPTSIVLDASASYAENGGTLKYSWKKIAGPDTYVLLFPDHMFPNVANLGRGSYTFRLTVTDEQGLTATSDVTFTVANQYPIARAAIKEYYSATSVVLDGSASYDPEGNPLRSYEWTKVAGPDTYTILFPDHAYPNVVNLGPGTYTFRLTVMDDYYARGTADITFTISQNAPPIAKAWLAEYKSSSSVLLSGWASYDPEGKPVTYQWSYVSGPASYSITDGTSYNATINNLVGGTYTFRLTVKDDQGLSASQDVTFTMNAMARINGSRNDLSVYDQSLMRSTLIIYPNPVVDMLQYKWSSAYKGDAKLTVMDMSGRAVKVLQLRKEHDDHISRLSVAQLKPGNYYLFIKLNGGRMLRSASFIKK